MNNKLEQLLFIRDIPKFCTFLGHELLLQRSEDDRFMYLIRKGQ